MSILIKGMKMPSCCGKCPFMYSGFYKGKSYPCVCYAKAQPMLIKPSETDMRDGLCPLVEIPEPHGDLIDRDALNIGEYDREDDDTGTLEISLGGLLDLYHKVKDATTII